MSQQPDDMRSLVNYLNKTAHAYYVLDDPLISDAEWDRLYSRLQQMEKEQGVVLPDSPSLRVGGEPLAAFRQHRHLSRLWSMDKAQSPEELQAWFDRTEKLRAQEPSLPPLTYGVEYKFDGLTLNLTYDHGVLIEAATRGNGEVGEAILPQARTVRGVPLSIPWQGLIEVQGECIMRLSALRKYNETAAEPLKNARNAAAGALRNLDPAVTAARNLSAFFYQVGTIENPPFSDQVGMVQFLREQGYVCLTLPGALTTLARHIHCGQEFPHEIGVFLDYPLADVMGFIAHKGSGFSCLGCWKAYGNAEQAQRTFALYHKCQAVYLDCYRRGFDVVRLTVAA